MNIFVYLAAVFIALSSADVCPPGWSPHQIWCYQAFVDTQMSWANAEAKCNNIGSQLVGVYNKTELAFVNGLIGPSMYSTWTGLIKNGSAWQFVDGTLNYMVFSVWLTGEPKDNSGGCAAIRSVDPVGLYPLPCHYAQPFVCKQFQALCDSKNSTYQYGTVTSPGYPTDYTNNLDCVQYIWGPPGTFVQLTFDVYIVESYSDYVMIYDGYGTVASRLLAKTLADPTQNGTKNSFQTKSNVMTLLFHTDASIVKKGWSASYLRIPDLSPVTQSGSNGHMISPNYPDNYPPNTEQYFYVNAPEGTQINATFDYFNTETRNDYLCIYDGPDDINSTLIGNFSGSGTLIELSSLQTTSNQMTLFFSTDKSVQWRGFSMYWTIF